MLPDGSSASRSATCKAAEHATRRAGIGALMTSPPCLSQKTSQPAINAVERAVSRKLATPESSAPPLYPNRVHSNPPACRPSAWRVRACPANRSVRRVPVHQDALRQCSSHHPGPATEAAARHTGFPRRSAAPRLQSDRLRPAIRMQVSRRAFYLHMKLGSIWIRFTARKLRSESGYCTGQVVGHRRR